MIYRSTVAAEAESVVPFPGGASWIVIVAIPLAQTTILKESTKHQNNDIQDNLGTHLLSNASKTTSFPALVDGVDNPVDPGVTADLVASVKGRTKKIDRNSQPCGWGRQG
jgi:hypothetical protein